MVATVFLIDSNINKLINSNIFYMYYKVGKISVVIIKCSYYNNNKHHLKYKYMFENINKFGSV